jgi:hypothetical protein
MQRASLYSWFAPHINPANHRTMVFFSPVINRSGFTQVIEVLKKRFPVSLIHDCRGTFLAGIRAMGIASVYKF